MLTIVYDESDKDLPCICVMKAGERLSYACLKMVIGDFGRGKYAGTDIDSFITIDDEGKYCININPGDPYELGYLCDIKFCPYCGGRLAESEEV